MKRQERGRSLPLPSLVLPSYFQSLLRFKSNSLESFREEVLRLPEPRYEAPFGTGGRGRGESWILHIPSDPR